MKENLFITGISGCIGHYLFEVLAKDSRYHLYLLVRDPKRLKFDLESHPNISLINDHLCNIRRYSELLKEMDFLIHLATDWGNWDVEYKHTLELFGLLDPSRCKKAIYFSTASILDSDNQPIKNIDKIGTPYIQAKYLCYKKLPELKIYDRIITLFPTWILGGNGQHPYSHASWVILKLLKWLWLIRFFKLDIRFHFIHAKDIALIVNYILKNEVDKSELVLGNPAISSEEFVREICEAFNRKIYFQINISSRFIRSLSLLSGKRLPAWDDFCLKKRHFEYKVVNTQTFGIKSDYQTIGETLKELTVSPP